MSEYDDIAMFCRPVANASYSVESELDFGLFTPSNKASFNTAMARDHKRSVHMWAFLHSGEFRFPAKAKGDQHCISTDSSLTTATFSSLINRAGRMLSWK